MSYRTISSNADFGKDCHNAATWLRKLCERLGASAELLRTEDHNPIVFAKFAAKGKIPSSDFPTILFYGHYDVVHAGNDQAWRSDPFRVNATNGYLYGRGVSDNKGPVLAALYAAAELAAESTLSANVVFIIEGEEESASRGFEKTVRENKHLIGNVDYILLANSYWLDDDIPCLTYGLRGVMHASVKIESPYADLHSGIDGSALLDEPLKDLTLLISSLAGPQGAINIPKFSSFIPPISKDEKDLVSSTAAALIARNPSLGDHTSYMTSLLRRWREPSLTVHQYLVSGPTENNDTIIPRHAQATLSLRLVPNQETSQIKDLLTQTLHSNFASLNSKNKLTVTINRQADPWLGIPSNAIFRALEDAVIHAWQPDAQALSRTIASSANDTATPITTSSKPLYIREGGSIPAIRFLEKEFGAPAAHLPCGQASDAAHLVNERLRVLNLYKSREIFRSVFGGLRKG